MSETPTKRILMCQPDFFDIEYEINPWMHTENQVDTAKAHRQWQQIFKIYQSLGYQIELIDPAEGLPDMVFTANGALVIDGKVALPRFLNTERQPETPLFEAWFKQTGFGDVFLPKNPFEGEGDCLYANDTLFAGYGFRSSKESHKELAEFFGKEVVDLELIDPRFYHLDTCFCPLGNNAVMFYPGAFAEPTNQIIREQFETVIEATEADAVAFGLNAVSDGRNVVLSDRAIGLIQVLKAKGFNPIPTDISEFQKSGGGVKCLTLELRN